MVSMRAHDLREAYLSFFERKGHRRLPGASLVPRGDPTLLLTGAGMVQFKPYFLGKAEPPYPRVTTCQRCVRTADIDRVGLTARHGTFFEMLGNFSFGDYFKLEAITWAWEFVTEVLEIPAERLWATIYLDDDEAFNIWHDVVGLPGERIVRLGKEDNFWEIGVGPCGPSSEIHIDRGPEYGCGKESCQPGCDCGRYLEFWNLVFIQFHKDEQGQYHPLQRKGIDTGMGMERTLAILQGVETIFETDEVRQILDRAQSIVGRRYGQDAVADRVLRVLVDHGRSVTFMAMDGILPGNEGRGYVMRRLLRRASRYAWLLGVRRPFWTELAGAVRDAMGQTYPELAARWPMIAAVLEREESRFLQTLEAGMSVLESRLATLRPGDRLGGEEAFRLYDTYGFPVELTREIAQEHGVEVDSQGFDRAMAAQRERARAARRQYAYLGEAVQGLEALGEIASRFEGYDHPELSTRVLALLGGGERISLAPEGSEVLVVLEATPFYPEGGGQVADAGIIEGRRGRLEVLDVQQPTAGIIVHRARVVTGEIGEGDPVVARIDVARRAGAARHHTGTHLLHRALRQVLGEHAVQAGSLVAPDRLRFDFNHYEPVSPEQLADIEAEVNRRILDDLPVVAVQTTVEAALAQGAMALFGEKYGEKVRMIEIGDGYSRELCGGTHVGRTGEIGLLTILSESSVAAGVRRIEAVAGAVALEYVQRRQRQWQALAARLHVGAEDVPQQVERLMQQLHEAQAVTERLREELLAWQAQAMSQSVERVGLAALVVGRLEGMDASSLRRLGDRLKAALGPAVIFLASPSNGKVLFVSMTTPELAKKGVHAGEIVKAAARAAGGDGGGQAVLAQAGARDASRIGQALEAARRRARDLLLLAGQAAG